MVNSSPTCSDSEAKKWMTVLMIIQADEERKVALREKSKDHAESGNTTKRISNGENVALVISTLKLHTNVNARFSVFERAKLLEQTLSQVSPCFIKLLETSDVQSETFLDTPESFCDKFLPEPEGHPILVDFILVDEDDQEYKMCYIFRTRRFVGTWREFCLDHNLASGDALVFNQTGNYKIKVYILKPNESTEDGQANGNQSNPYIHDNPYDTGNAIIVRPVKPLDVELPPIDVQAETATPRSNSSSSNRLFQKERLYLDNGTRIVKTVKPLDAELPPIDVQSEAAAPSSNSNPTPLIDLSDHSSNNSCSDMDISSDIEISSSVPNFMEVTSFDDFKICVKGEILDTKISPKHRMLYYELCNSQKMFLHEHVGGFLRSDVLRMIQRTIIIAEATKSANISTSIHDLENMERDLIAFEDSGMAVGFLCKRMNKLVKYLAEHQMNTESRKRKMAQMEDEWTALKEETLTLENLTKSMAGRRSLLGNYEDELDILKVERRELEYMISDVVDSAW